MESLSTQLMPLFDWLLRTTLQAALLFCLIMLIKLVLRGRLPIRWHYCLWLLLLIRMATPWLPESKISVFNWVPRSIQHGGIIKSLSQPQDARGMGFYMRGEAADSQEAESETTLVKFARILPALWLFGTAALAVYVGACNFHLWWLVTRERPLTDQKILDLLEDCKAEMGIRNILGIVTTDKVKSAALFGFIRPRLLLPAGMVETLSRQELRYVFMHELGHLRRRDIYVGWLMSLLQVLHWFNPLVWLAFYRMQSDRELACDALVLSYTRSGESKEYGRTIVNLLERFSRPQRLPSMAGILENKSQLKRRIKMIAKFKNTSRTRGAGAVLLLAALVCIVLTNAYVAKADFTFGAPINLGPTVNSSMNEYDPSVSGDSLSLFIEHAQADWSGVPEAWLATRATQDDPWQEVVSLGPWANSKETFVPAIEKVLNEAMGFEPGHTTADGLELYTWDDMLGGYGGMDLFVMKRETADHEWGPPQNLGSSINSSSRDNSSFISPDGLTLHFASMRPGGLGRTDIWVTTRKTRLEPWGTPVNLGPAVNSPSTDYNIGMSTDSLLLFFASNRPGGYGEVDLWVSKRASVSEPWPNAVNLGPIVNSSADDDSPCISADGFTLYFSSSRSGGYGGYDIWMVSILPVVDFNADGIVDGIDVCMMLDYWHTDEPLYDIAPMPFADGIVDVKDLVLISEYLTPKEVDPNAVTP